MQKFKRFAALALMLCLLVSMMPRATFAAVIGPDSDGGIGNEGDYSDSHGWDHPTSGACGNNLYYDYSGNVLRIYGTGAMYDYDARMFEDIPWCWSFSDPSDVDWVPIDEVIIEGATTIGEYAFINNGFSSVHIPVSVESIGCGAFNYVSDVYYGGSRAQWENISIASGNEALTNATIHFTQVIIASGTCGENLTWTLDDEGTLTISGTGPMYNWDDYKNVPWYNYRPSIRKAVIEDGVTTIGDRAFAGSYYLTDATIPDSVTVLGERAFEASALKNITLGKGLTAIGDCAFEYTSLTSITLPDGVTTIGEGVFRCCSSLTSVTLPDSVTTIGYGAFNCDNKLTSVTLGSSVTMIGDYAFAETGLTTITIPDSVTTIGSHAFANCEKLTSVTIGSGVTTIGENAFAYCSELSGIWVDEDNEKFCSDSTGTLYDKNKTLLIKVPTTYSGCFVIPSSVLRIRSGAFQSCQALTSVMIPYSASMIDEYAFTDCSNLKNVYYPYYNQTWVEIVYVTKSTNESLFDATFHFKDTRVCGENLTWDLDSNGTLTISGTGTMTNWSDYSSAPWYGFSDFIKKVVIEDGVTTIGDNAFGFCNVMTEVEIPESVTSIGYGAFVFCDSLTSVKIPDRVSSIGKSAFYYCTGLTSINIPNSITTIDDGVFNYCSRLKSITVPDSVTIIGNGAFDCCLSLSEITLGNGVTTIGKWAFNECLNLTEITLPVSITSIGDGAFSECSRLTDVYYGGTQKQWEEITIESNNEPLLNATIHTVKPTLIGIAIKAQPAKTEYWAGETLDTTGLTLAATYSDGSTETVTEGFTLSGFDSTTFDTQTITVTYEGLTASFEVTVTLGGICGENLTWTLDDAGALTISGTGAMTNWSSSSSVPWYDYRSTIKSVNIGNGTTTIGDWAFCSCDSLTSVTIPDSVTSVGSFTFEGCTDLVSITIPDSVTTIGSSAFFACTNLTSIIIPDGVTRISASTFESCSNLTSVTIPNTVTIIGGYAFCSCTNLKCITIPDSVTSIGQSAFDACDSLTSITIPGSVTSIGSVAFESCDSLTSVTILDGVTSIGLAMFYHCDSLVSVTIPDSVTSIDLDAFAACDSLTDVYYAGAESKWSAINIESGNTPLTNATLHLNHIHDYSLIPAVTVDATCTETGYIDYTCIYGDTYRVVIPATGHNYGENATVVAPSCTEQGYTAMTCIHCNETVMTDYVDALGHNYSGTETVVEPKCEAQGYTDTQCVRCEAVNRSDYVDSLGHKMVVVPSVEATCTDDGRTIGTSCERCGKIGVAGSVIPAKGHSFTDGVCTVCGTESCNHPAEDNGNCSICGKVIATVVTDSEGNVVGNFISFAQAMNAAVPGSTVTLREDLTEADVILTAGVNLDLNGYTLTADSVLTYSSSAIIDTSEDVSGLLKIKEDGNMISKDNAQLAVYDNEAGGYRFFAIDVQPCAVTGNNKYWFKIKAEKFAPLYNLIQADSEVQIKVKMTWDGQTEDTYATAGLSFTKTWADRYNANEDIYITICVAETEGIENFKLIPMITSGGVEISGEEME